MSIGNNMSLSKEILFEKLIENPFNHEAQEALESLYKSMTLEQLIREYNSNWDEVDYHFRTLHILTMCIEDYFERANQSSYNSRTEFINAWNIYMRQICVLEELINQRKLK